MQEVLKSKYKGREAYFENQDGTIITAYLRKPSVGIVEDIIDAKKELADALKGEDTETIKQALSAYYRKAFPLLFVSDEQPDFDSPYFEAVYFKEFEDVFFSEWSN
jgi:hypothetical protein